MILDEEITEANALVDLIHIGCRDARLVHSLIDIDARTMRLYNACGNEFNLTNG